MVDFGLIADALQPFYLRIVLALIILVTGLICGQLASRLVRKVLSELQLDRLIKRVTSLSIRLESLAANAVRYLIYFVFIVWALERAGLGSIILNILAGGILAIIILALLLGLKDFIPNMAAGLYVQGKGIIRRGDYIKCDNVEGTVEDIDLVEVKISTRHGDMIYVPNSALLKGNIVKKT